MKFYAVIDTNVLVSSLLSSQSYPGEILKLIKDLVIVPLINNEILKEYNEVLTRNKFPFTEKIIIETFNLFKNNGIMLERTKTKEFFADKDDIVFYEIALTGNKTNKSYLVTGNIKHFPKKSFVVTPKEMIDIIESEK